MLAQYTQTLKSQIKEQFLYVLIKFALWIVFLVKMLKTDFLFPQCYKQKKVKYTGQILQPPMNSLIWALK